MIIYLYLIAFFSFVIGLGAIFTLVEKFPVKWLYYHYHIRKPLLWVVFLGTLSWIGINSLDTILIKGLPPLAIIGLSLLLSYKAHQENWFRAVYFPPMASDTDALPIKDENQLALIEVNGISKAYPLDYVVHHHIINDSFGDKTIALTYCAMCRSIIPFDVTEIGPLFVASFKNANMIVADKKTKTFFQQATFNSIIGRIHPYSLKMIPFQILSWKDIKELTPMPQIAKVVPNDFRAFSLPMPGVWKKVMSTELTPGLSTKDKTFPSKTAVIGISDSSGTSVVYLKTEVNSKIVVKNERLGFTLISVNNTVNGFKNKIGELELNLSLDSSYKITDLNSDTIWDLRGKYMKGPIKGNLESIFLSDEYWFSWKKFHKDSVLIRLP